MNQGWGTPGPVKYIDPQFVDSNTLLYGVDGEGGPGRLWYVPISTLNDTTTWSVINIPDNTSYMWWTRYFSDGRMLFTNANQTVQGNTGTENVYYSLDYGATWKHIYLYSDNGDAGFIQFTTIGMSPTDNSNDWILSPENSTRIGGLIYLVK